MTNYHYRKYEGAPIPEKRKFPPKEPAPPRFHQKTGPKPKPDEEIVDTWKVRPKPGKRWWWWSEPRFSVHTGSCTRIGYSSVVRYIIRRFRANLVRSNSMGIWWLQNEATKEQISPEFSNYDCFYDWLIFNALKRGWVWVESHEGDRWDFKKQKMVHQRWVRLTHS